ncbi:MAG: hypothetical protein FVQ82_06020 [Planctomycetes bacterium]|nr:hypothetical protein [Planctomycetota bacterium]
MSIEQILMERDGMTQQEAAKAVENARTELWERLDAGEMPDDICQELFGLEPDFLEELIY